MVGLRRLIAAGLSLWIGGCSDPGEPSRSESCAHATDYQDVCARVSGTVRDTDGQPLESALVKLITTGNPFFHVGPVRTDASGRFALELSLNAADLTSPSLSLPAYLRAAIDKGEEAFDTSVVVNLELRLEGEIPPTLASNLVIDDRPRPAPPGRMVCVFEILDLDDKDLFLINGDGSGRTPLRTGPTYDGDPHWTPDGRSILFSQEGTLLLIDPDGTNLRPFGGLVGAGALRWSPDGAHLAYLQGYTDLNGLEHGDGLWVANSDGSDERRLPTYLDQACIRSCSGISGLSWFPDSDRIGYHVAVRGTAGYVQEAFYTTRVSDSTMAPMDLGIRNWSPDGTRYTLSSWIELAIYSSAGDRIASIPVGANSEVFGAWSPDSQWLAYSFYDYDAERFELWVATADGGGRRRIALDSHAPDWQPGVAAAP